jgi:LysR family glycine cleavage system transcriptional activator
MRPMREKIARMAFRMPPLNAVRAFAAAARHLSFTLAAAELHVTHGAVSRQVKALEQHLGVALFERRVRQIVLTEEGLAFFEEVDAALAQISGAAHALMAKAPVRAVRINVRPSFAVRWLIPRLPGFVAQCPGVEPQVVTSIAPLAKSTEAFDVAIRRGSEGWPSAMQVRPFLKDEAVLVAAPALLRKRLIGDARALEAHVLLSSKSRKEDWGQWKRFAGVPRLKPAGQLQFDHLHFVLQAAVDGLGVALGPRTLVSQDLSSGRLKAPLPTLCMPLDRHYYGIAPDAEPEARLFADWLEHELRSQR